MVNRNQVPHMTPRAKAARRRDRIAGAALFVVAIVAVALTAYVWHARSLM